MADVRSLFMEFFDAQFTRPGAFGRRVQRRRQAVHVITTIAIVAEQQLIVIVRRAANRAAFALDALPSILLDGNVHVGRELQAAGMTYERGQARHAKRTHVKTKRMKWAGGEEFQVTSAEEQ